MNVLRAIAIVSTLALAIQSNAQASPDKADGPETAAATPTTAPAEASITLSKLTEFPSVGVTMAFPADQRPTLSTDPTCLGAYVKKGDKSWQAITSFYAFKLAGNEAASVQDIAENLMRQHEKQPRFTASKWVWAQPTKVQGQECYQIAANLTTSDGPDQVIVVSVFQAAHDEQRLNFTHALLVQARGYDVADALATSNAVLGSIQIGKVRSPAQESLYFQSGVRAKGEGFSVAVPQGWCVKQLTSQEKQSLAFWAGINDYVEGEVLNINVTVSPINDLTSVDNAYLDEMVAAMKIDLANMQWKPVSAGLTRLAGQDAAQVVASDVILGRSMTTVTRQAIFDGKVYTITLTYPAEQADNASAAMDKIAEGFKLTPPKATTRPSTPVAGN